MHALQWGRGLATADLCRTLRRGSAMQALQWGRGHATADLALLASPRSRHRAASMGPRSATADLARFASILLSMTWVKRSERLSLRRCQSIVRDNTSETSTEVRPSPVRAIPQDPRVTSPLAWSRCHGVHRRLEPGPACQLPRQDTRQQPRLDLQHPTVRPTIPEQQLRDERVHSAARTRK